MQLLSGDMGVSCLINRKVSTYLQIFHRNLDDKKKIKSSGSPDRMFCIFCIQSSVVHLFLVFYA